MFEYRIHPSIGVARVGNSTLNDFYLSPKTIGGRPIECDKNGNELDTNGNKLQNDANPKFVKKFKNKNKMIRKQAAKFRIYKYDLDKPDSLPVEVDLTNTTEFESVKWTVHLANKKSAWHEFDEFSGDLMVGKNNVYPDDSLRNSDVEDRKTLLVDYGPRSLETKEDSIRIAFGDTVPLGYDYHTPKFENSTPRYGQDIKYLGEIKTDSKQNLVVLGGHGYAGGDEEFGSFGGGDSWYDDMSDGPVICELTLANGQRKTLDAWVIVGPPKVAPELINITTLDDVMYDVAVRHMGKAPQIYDINNANWKTADYNSYWNPDFIVSFSRDIEPIVKRMGNYRWVSNIPSMLDFCMPQFDMRDPSDANKRNREKYFNYFRRSANNEWGQDGESNKLFSNNDYLGGIPLVPLSSGSNSVTNGPDSGSQGVTDKFAQLTRTQYYFLEQWAKGKFTTEKIPDPMIIHQMDRVDVGNCVGIPMCPGIEVTFTVRNPSIYSAPYRIKHKAVSYLKTGLDPDYEETAQPFKQSQGCEPGDLTKRMACPWQSDLFECTVQNVNFTDLQNMKSDDFEKPPLYFVYWWPPQAPWDVILGVTEPELDPNNRDIDGQKKDSAIAQLQAAGLSAGQQVVYSRGINNHIQMVKAWSYLGFIVNQNDDEETRDDYPYFVEKERNHDAFMVLGIAAVHPANIRDPSYTRRFIHSLFLKEDKGSN